MQKLLRNEEIQRLYIISLLHPVWGGTACQITGRSSCVRRNCSVNNLGGH
ncbi:hypothetical protein RchiOBHm_Chr4g0429421 [Rosa chinensis]|uniref:Uncharacterized protein n=1 Tax=Rosa chinensis TaxID=74649 RepID=A0A2P6R067_ROSCH|nr:hypothetical protein RchiOBHm_Chr4g0429421 [Rosa chinensis]